MHYKLPGFKLDYRIILYFMTFASFCFIIIFLILFTIFAPGNYQLDNTEQSIKASIWNGTFAFLLLVNNICVIFSLFEVIKIIIHIIKNKRVNIKCLINMMIGLYPFVVNYYIYRDNYFKVIQYIIVQIRMVFKI